LSSFIGREHEIAEVVRLLQTKRLLTLTGMGGACKTPFALQAAAEILDEFKDGVWLVGLASLALFKLKPPGSGTAPRERGYRPDS
jgi:hypothetical protein